MSIAFVSFLVVLRLRWFPFICWAATGKLAAACILLAGAFSLHDCKVRGRGR